MGNIAVIDTETSWNNLVMSIGVVIAREEGLVPLDERYYVLTPEMEIGGMFEKVLFVEGIREKVCTRQEAMGELTAWLESCGVQGMYAYNAGFDKGHLPELGHLPWYDIMRLAAYRQTNPRIPADAPCCSTGRLKRGYGVEAMMQLLTGNRAYREVHNALQDARDELQIMALLGHGLENYCRL